MLSTAIPTLIDATVIVIISNGILNNPSNPKTETATNKLGIRPINANLIERNKNINIKPITKKTISKSYGLRHKAAVGITEDTDAISLVISEETGKVSYIQNGRFCKFKNLDNLKELILKDLAN